MSYHLANKLAKEGQDVVFISKVPYYEQPQEVLVNGHKIILTSWPSKVKNSSLKDIIWFIKLFRKFSPHTVLGHYNGGLVSIILSKILSFGKVLTIDHHHTCSEGFILDKGKLDTKLKIFFLRRRLYYQLFCDYVICPSEYALDDLRNFFKYKNGKTIPHALSDRFVPQTKLVRDFEGEIKLCYLGRLDKGKNVALLLNSIKTHHQNYPESKITVHIAGFSLEPDQATLNEIEVPYIRFSGRLKYENIDEFFQSHDCCIIPSKSDSFNLVAIESLMNDTPIIITTKCGVTDFLEDSVDCFMVKPDEDSLREILEKIEKDPESLKRLDSRKAFLSKFEMEIYLQNFENFFKSINVLNQGLKK